VTGGAGYIGSHAVLELLDSGFRTVVLDDLVTGTRPRTLGRFKETIRRTGAGWINTFTEDALRQTFGAGGFILTETHDWHASDGSERIFVFNAEASRPDINLLG
jgi:nucleoside-diphosphate-sugar epimerase